jgi:peptidoglycan hydrolase-like protein with peptidoglycan-binding domain
MATTFAVLKEGSTGANVRELQTNLTALKYYTGGIDGNFGSKTKDAVIKFQQSHAVKVDGIVGYETQAPILREVWISKQPTLKEGSQGQEVRNLQDLLNGTGELPKGQFGTIKVDGVFGANTKAAVIKFQKSTDITADGVVGLKTWKQLSLRESYNMSPEQIVVNGIFNLA